MSPKQPTLNENMEHCAKVFCQSGGLISTRPWECANEMSFVSWDSVGDPWPS